MIRVCRCPAHTDHSCFWTSGPSLSARQLPTGVCNMADAWSGMRGIAAVPTYVVMQPTTLCNLDCSYCYLPFRAVDKRMPVEVAAAVAASPAAVGGFARAGGFSVVWRGGEPLAAGRDHLAALLAPFRDVEHHVQT